ncbi:alpha/beta fold hydrolase [Roseitranquillus sediminis]|uniref:alpha/beta fold hydrolase n=1 Tax=Roseitranquillus sediminis TaxID=2809051 RepID=UPI001D0C3D16|nr:alpha/beta fold hydrolase [Roseitranquillus sediminis]MBM9594779.1 alpha/beta fold hydrolase [Roseitranquillus sediminis]
MKLAAQTQGAGAPLVIAHGLFGSGRNWGVVAKRLADIREVTTVDMRNHGDSPWRDDHSYEAMADDLAEVVGDRPADVMGHSMGGKAAMVLALRRPDLVRRLVVVDIAAVAYEHSQMELVEAMRATDLTGIERRSEAAERMPVDDPQVKAFLLQSLDAANRCWKLNLDVFARQMDAITGWPGTDGRFDGPALLIRGEASDYAPDERLEETRRLFPRLEVVTVQGAGHWVHAEKPREVEAAVRSFLDT